MLTHFAKATSLATILFLTYTGIAQETHKGVTYGIGSVTDIRAMAVYDSIHRGEIRERPMVIKNKIIIRNEVDPTTSAFNGVMSTVETPTNIPEAVQQFPCVNFNALDDDGTSFPPDVNGAVGFNHLVTTLNTQVRMQTKQGVEVNTSSLAAFWNGLGGHVDIFDPKITYDPYDQRWFFVCCATRDNANSALLLAVSQTYDPTGPWNTYTIDADPGNQFWFDYPSLGFNRQWITVGGYLFNRTGMSNTERSRVWVINKADVYAGIPNITVTFFDRNDYFHISPAMTYNPNDNTQWLVSLHNNNSANSGFVRLFSLTGTGANPIFNVGGTVNVGPAWTGGGVNGPQSGNATGLNLGDDRILQCTFRNNTLWLGNNVFLPATTPTTCAAQIVAINTVTGTATENIRTTVDNTGATMNAYPSITVNQNNDIFFGYTNFNTTAFARAALTYRRAGQGFFTYNYKAGEDWYVKLFMGVNRWGDYSGTLIDPEDDMTAWTIQQYARPRQFAGTVSFWGTWWAKVCPVSCTPDFFLSAPYNGVNRRYEATNSIVSSAQLQSNSFIKYDAGVRITLSPGFKVIQGNRFQAYIDGCGGTR